MIWLRKGGNLYVPTLTKVSNVADFTPLSLLTSVQVVEEAMNKINNGELDKDFSNYNNWAVPLLLTFKEKIMQGTAKLERNLTRKEARRNTEEKKLRQKMVGRVPSGIWWLH